MGGGSEGRGGLVGCDGGCGWGGGANCMEWGSGGREGVNGVMLWINWG